MRCLPASMVLLLACATADSDPVAPDDSADTDDSGSGPDTSDTADTGDTADTADSADTGEGPDADGDGWADSLDCAPADAKVHPEAAEACNDTDDDCDGVVDDIDAGGFGCGRPDADADGWTSAADEDFRCWCEDPGFPITGTRGDCDDAVASTNPFAVDVCDGVDNDCDGVVDPADARYLDADGDGYGDAADVTTVCTDPGPRVADATDCDDGASDVHPAAREACNGKDDDCDGLVDEGAWFVDADGDGYGAGAWVETCVAGMVSVGGDDDDATASAYPGAVERCNGVDDDGDARVDEGLTCTACEDVAEGFDLIVPDDVATVQGAIDRATSGERICVRAGTWNEAIDFGGKDVLLYGEAGPGGTVLDGTGLDAPVVTFASGEGPDAELVGFTLTGGAGHTITDRSFTIDYCSGSSGPYYTVVQCGGGVYVDGASPTLRDLVVRDMDLGDEWSVLSFFDGLGSAHVQRISLGGGVCALDSAAVLERVDVQDVSAYHGGAGYFGAGSVVEWSESRLEGAHANTGGGFYIEDSTLTTTNVTDDGASAEVGAFVYANTGGVTLENSTSHGGSSSGALVFTYYSDTTIRNSILSGGSAGYALYAYAYGETLDLEYSLAWNPTGDTFVVYDSGVQREVSSFTGLLELEPTFRDLGAADLVGDDDLRLAEGSAGVDAGNPDSAYNDVDGTRNDLGGYGGPGGSW